MSKLVDVIVEAVQDKKAKDIVTLDLSGIEGAICDTFVICSADSTTQVEAIADEVEKQTYEKLNENVVKIEGKGNSIWIVMDYGDLMVHIFQTEARLFYALDELWSDTPMQKYESFA